MTDRTEALFLKADDEVVTLGAIVRGDRARMRVLDAFVVVHRGQSTFTHVYLVPRQLAAARVEVLLAAVFEGDAMSSAVKWVESSTCPARCDPEVKLAA